MNDERCPICLCVTHVGPHGPGVCLPAAYPPEDTPTPKEWSAAMDAERARQIADGYDDAHDAKHGVEHLLNWAIDYDRRGNSLAAATMTRCALRLLTTHTNGSGA